MFLCFDILGFSRPSRKKTPDPKAEAREVVASSYHHVIIGVNSFYVTLKHSIFGT